MRRCVGVISVAIVCTRRVFLLPQSLLLVSIFQHGKYNSYPRAAAERPTTPVPLPSSNEAKICFNFADRYRFPHQVELMPKN